MSTRRTKIVEPAQRACDACPWRTANQGKRTSGGWYTRKNLRRLWSGLRRGDAPGMTCHPTDPDNPPNDDGRQAREGTETRECYGAVLLLAREVHFGARLCKTHDAGAFAEYRKLRPRGLTRAGFTHWLSRFFFGGLLGTGAALPTELTEDDGIQHPDFEAPERDL